MMKLKKVDFFAIDTQQAWEKLYASNKHLSPYMSYEFQKIFYKNFCFSVNRYSMKREIFAAINDNGEIVCILPLCKKGSDYWILGDFCATGSLDFIYDEKFTNSDFDELYDALSEKFCGGHILHLNKINESSYLNTWLRNKFDPLKKGVCVNIPFGDNFDNYLKGLAKTYRNNISNAKNKLAREAKSWRVEVKIGGDIEKSQFRRMMQIYDKRESERRGKRTSPIVSLIRNHFNPITVSLKKLENSLQAMIYIDNIMAGFLSGYINNGNSAVVFPRLAIDSDYSGYRPGYLLITETIRYLIENTDIRNLDLSRGDEKYKYDLGGVEHYNYFYDLVF